MPSSVFNKPLAPAAIVIIVALALAPLAPLFVWSISPIRRLIARGVEQLESHGFGMRNGLCEQDSHVVIFFKSQGLL